MQGVDSFISKKKWLLFLLICSILVVVWIVYWWDRLNYNENTRSSIIETYHDNKEQFYNLSNYVKDSQGEMFIYKETDSTFSVTNDLGEQQENTIINDKDINLLIKHFLLDLNFNVISEEGKSIYFQKYSFLSFAMGIVYSKDGSIPSSTQDMTLEKIEGNWYFYTLD